MGEKDNHKKNLNRVVRHAEVFADFWLGMAGAAARGVAEALGKPEPVNGKTHEELDLRRIEKSFEQTVDRAAKGFHAAFEAATRAAKETEDDLKEIHSENHKGHAS